MKRISLILLSAIIFAGSFLYLFENKAEAGEYLYESPWNDKDYAYKQWMKVYVRVGNNQEKQVDANWRPVFCSPGTLEEGHTADRASNVSQKLANWMKAANLYDEEHNHFIFSKPGAEKLGLTNQYMQYSSWHRNIPIRHTSSMEQVKSDLGRSYSKLSGGTLNKPLKVKEGPPCNIYWESTNNQFHYAISLTAIDGQKRGIIELSKKHGADVALVQATKPAAGWAEMHMYFPYNTLFTQLAPTIFGDVTALEEGAGQIYVANLAPWLTLSSKTKFRVYVWEDGEPEPSLCNTQNLTMEPFNPTPVGFNFPVPDNRFRLILTTNMYWSGGRWVNEPLATYNQGPVSELESEYARNKVEVVLTPGDPSGQGDTTEPSNLAVTDLQLLNRDDEPVGGTVIVNEPYKVKATFKSTFDQGGWANIRFYVQREAGWMEFKDVKYVYFEPEGTLTHTWNWTGMGEGVTLMATVSYKWWEQQDKWKEELFEGETETTYNDNKMEMETVGTDTPDGPPTPGSWYYPVYYHPMVEQVTPIYETITHEKVVKGWVEVPFHPAEEEADVKAILVE